MSCFLVPSSVYREIESLMADFLWHNKDVRKIHWLAWDKVCASKALGGLGAFNIAMLAKQLWRVIIYLDSLLNRVWKQKYFPACEWFEARCHRPLFRQDGRL
ncbi:UNVERIFIED_CONTAM: hypothetical protein Sradi_3010900 [Sesamum radiatum]|uniref:Uncharacterized protein n=1 Tax=Sesamum radiatum TaxID=300843 RepID=A0AAW2S0Z7_SESRA